MKHATRLLLLAALTVAACASGTERDGPPPLPVEIEGNHSVSTRRLTFAARREMASFEEHGRRPADLADAAYSMELELRRLGYAHAEVRFRQEATAEAPERVAFDVNEGPLGLIGDVTFSGLGVFKPADLLKFIPTGNKQPFLQSQIDGAVGEIERTYLLAGYREARVGPAGVTWNDEKTRADILIPIDEGPQYVIGDYVVDGELSESLKQRFLDPLRGDGFYLRLPAEAAANIRAALMNKGHLQAAVTVETAFEETRATLTFHVQAGPAYRVGKVIVTGRDRTRERFVRSRIPLRQGDIASQAKVDEGVDALYRTGIFRAVDATKSYPEQLEADIEYALEELDARSVSFEIGWGSYELLRGGVLYQDRNFMGFGRRLDIDATASTVGYGLAAAVSDNYLLGPANTLRMGASIFRRQEPSFTRFGYDFSLSLTHKLSKQVKFTFGYSFDTQQASDIQTGAPEFEEGEFLTSAGLFTNLVYDSRDSKLIPTKGSIGEVGVLWSTPALGADLNFVGMHASWFSFFPLTDNITIGTGFRLESRPLLDGSLTLPITQRLFLGGPTTIRSFNQSQLGPFNPETNEPVGGLTLASAHVEVRARVWRELHFATFYELGTVDTRALTIEGPAGQAIGAGLRYYLPIGPIRIDAAYNPGETFAQSSRWAFHFAFGFSF